MTTIAKVVRIPQCDFCKEEAKALAQSGVFTDFVIQPAEYDFKTVEGPWAFGCKEHFNIHCKYDSLGLGKGQKLELLK